MIHGLPYYINIAFLITTAFTFWFLLKAAAGSKLSAGIMLVLLCMNTVLGYTRFFTVTDTIPPRFLVLVLPPALLILFLFLAKKGKLFIDGLNIKRLTLLHVVRIPVEVVLLWLFLHKHVPQLMTFEGRNFDIFSGITAPLIFYFGLVKNKFSKKILLAWNLICLALLLNIVINAVLAVPGPLQCHAFDQPNVAVLYFPFVWLPGFIVPVVLFSHLVSIRQLLKRPGNI